MIEKTLIIEAPNGLHVRPASVIVKLAKTFESDITITIDDKSASAKSLFKLQLLDLSFNKELKIVATGPDEEKAAQELFDYISSIKE